MTPTENTLATQEGCVTTIKRGLTMLVNSDAGLEKLTLELSFYLEMAQQAIISNNRKEGAVK